MRMAMVFLGFGALGVIRLYDGTSLAVAGKFR